MEEKEFNSRLSLIQNLVKASDDLELDINTIKARLDKSLANVLKNNKERDSKFLQYMQKQKELGFSDNLTSPSDLFPGIKTAIEMADPEKLSKDAEELKQLAYDIENISKIVNQENTEAINSLKRCLTQISEYIIQKNQVYDLCLELLQDSDSIYDIGDLASNI